MKKLRRIMKNKKGFTLVEVIVVLVIIAILAALLIPSLTGYISKANDAAAIAEARTALVALQTEASENGWDAQADVVYADVAALAEIPLTSANFGTMTFTGNKVQGFVYISAENGTVTYNATPAAGADKFTVK